MPNGGRRLVQHRGRRRDNVCLALKRTDPLRGDAGADLCVAPPEGTNGGPATRIGVGCRAITATGDLTTAIPRRSSAAELVAVLGGGCGASSGDGDD